MSGDYLQEKAEQLQAFEEYASVDAVEELACSMIRAEGKDPGKLSHGEKSRYIYEAREIIYESRLSQLETMYEG